MGNTSNNEQSEPGWDDMFTILSKTGNPALKHAIKKMDIGRPVTYTKQIGAFICNLVANGKTIQNVIDIYNESVPDTKLNKTKIYSWLHNIKLKTFHDHYYYARELSTNGILDDIIDLENDIISDAVSFKSGRVVLESKRWRAKVQNPDYFNPVQKQEIEDNKTIIIKASIPVPLPLPGHLQVEGGTSDVDVVEGEVTEDRGPNNSE